LPIDLIIRRVRIEDREGLHDIAVDAGRIIAIAPSIEESASVELDGDGRLASPALIEPHIHLDKVGSLPLLPPNRSGTLAEAISLLHETKRAASIPEIAERAGVVIRQAVLAGATVIRSHVDVDTIGGLRPLRGVLQARAEHADLCDIQIVAFPQEGIDRDPGAAELMEAAMEAGADLVGGMPHWELDRDAAGRHVEFCFDLAERHDADIDMHVDELDDPNARTLELVTDAVEAHAYGGRVTASHCCSMVAWEQEYADRIIRRMAEVGVHLISNPLSLVLQGRNDAEPRRRGIARVKECLAAGVVCGTGQDCVNDAFYPFGAGDPLQVALLQAHAAQLTEPEEIKAVLGMVREAAARILRLPDYGLYEGARGDVIVLDAETPLDALRLQAPRRWTIRGGRIVAENARSVQLHRLPQPVPT
jgi:cytosine/creatinine deaminase